MDLFEFQGKELFAQWGVPIPEGRVATTPAQAREIAESLGGSVVVKAQVQVGGRGKAGGIKLAEGPQQAEAAAAAILGMDIKGHVVDRVLVERASDIKAEYYASFTLDRAAKSHLVMLSSKGGVDIEEVAATDPDALERVHVDSLLGLTNFQVNQLIFGSGIDPESRKGVALLLTKLWRLYIEADADLVEVNPMILTGQGDVIALDAKVSLDESAFFRHPEFESMREVVAVDPQERLAKQRGFGNFIKLDGNIGVIGNGAGLVMSTLDVIDQVGGRAANFLDVGGGADAESLSSALEVVLSNAGVRSVLINIFGGITRCDLVAQGVTEALNTLEVSVPIVVRLDGTNAEEGHNILKKANHPRIVPAATMQEAANKAVEAAR